MTLNHAFPAFFSAIVFICLAGPTTPKVSADVIIDATADGFITDEGIVDDDDNFVRARLGGGGFENRGIIEFDLSTLAGGVTIESVEFRGYSSLVTTGTVVEVYGYNGTSPIAIENGDYNTSGTLMATLNEGTEIFNDVDFSFALSDFSVIQAAADSNDVFGIRIEMTTLNDTWNIGSSEFNEATPSIRIGLSAVPEPTAVTFGMFALAGLIVRRKRCR